MEIKIIKKPISRVELKKAVGDNFGDIVKAVVDVEKEIMAIGGEMHMDELELLIEKENSNHQNIWGINLLTEKEDDQFIEFDSMVNLKPAFGNRTRGVDNPEIQKRLSRL